MAFLRNDVLSHAERGPASIYRCMRRLGPGYLLADRAGDRAGQPDVQAIQRTSHLFYPMPKEMDTAFFDRIHFWLPGWEQGKTRDGLYASHSTPRSGRWGWSEPFVPSARGRAASRPERTEA